MPHILHIGEQYCDGNPELGFTNSIHNLYNTFSQCRPEQYNLINFDTAQIIYKAHIDNILIDYVKKYDIKIIFICLMNGYPGNPSINILKQLKEMGCYLVFHFPDFGPGFGSQTAKELEESYIADLLIVWDNGLDANEKPLYSSNKTLRLFVPQDRTLYFKDNQEIPVSFVGTIQNYYDRTMLVPYIQKYFPTESFIGGGQRQQKLSPYTYAKIIRKSKINLNYSLSLARFWQVKGRVFEILASGSLLLEYKNPSTSKLFTPDVDYVEFDNPREMVEKVRYYLDHEEERKKIAEQGYQTYNKKYTAQIFWDSIMDRIYKDLNEANKT